MSHYGTDHEQLDLNPQEDLQGAIEQFAYYSDEPSADAGALPVWFLSRMCKTHATVALSGEGADEIFAGYLTYRANQLARTARSIACASNQGWLSKACASGPSPTRRSAWNTSSNAFSRAACYPRNGPMSTGMEPSPRRPRRPCCGVPCPGAMGNILERLAQVSWPTTDCTRIWRSINSTIWPTTSW